MKAKKLERENLIHLLVPNGLSNGGMASPGVISDLMQLHQPFLYRKGLQFAFSALSKCFQ